jgi:peptidoglycan pentaglycine glycine transferase (the first glycine)
MKVNLKQWNDYINEHPNAHILQSGAWGELKSSFAWKAVRVISGSAGAQVLFRKLPGGFSIGYIPKGPVVSSPELFNEIDLVCHEEKAVFLKVEPDDWEPAVGFWSANQPGWIQSRPIQPQRTVILNLEGSDEEILGRMKQKTRYNIHLAEKKEIEVRASTDVKAYHVMSEVTGARDGFGVHSQSYYQKALDLMDPDGAAALLLAYYQEKPVAGLLAVAQGEMAWYLYGASSDEERNRMPTYLIQWQAMQWAKAKGCKYYDLWGIPDVDEDVLEGEFSQKGSHDGLWGVYRFKRGFGGEVMRSVGAWDKVYLPLLYKLYQLMTKLRGRSDE